jgi:hypothetical protein
MDWLELLDQIFDVCIIPLLGIATTALIIFIKRKIAEGQAKTDSEITAKYLGLLEQTVIDCIKATNQTYVNALKDKNAFTAEAQKEALALTTKAVVDILSDEAKTYLTHFVGDLDKFIAEKIEANIENTKK